MKYPRKFCYVWKKTESPKYPRKKQLKTTWTGYKTIVFRVRIGKYNFGKTLVFSLHH